MSDVHILAIDLAKRSFQVCGTDRGGSCVDAPDFARVFFRLLLQVLLLSVVCQASHRGQRHGGRYAVRRTGSTSVQRALCSSPGTGLPRPEH